MGKLLSYLDALFGRPSRDAGSAENIAQVAGLTAPRDANAPRPDADSTLGARIYAHRERLFLCAAELLDDPDAALQIVAETMRKARELSAELTELDTLSAVLDRLLLGLTVERLKVLAIPRLAEFFARQEPEPNAAKAALPWKIGSDGNTGPTEDAAFKAAPNRTAAQSVLADAFAADSNPEETSGDGLATEIERTTEVLGQLPIESRIAVMLVIMQGRPLSEVSKLLGANEETCSFFLNHGRKLLRRILQRDLSRSDGRSRAAELTRQPAGGTATLYDLRRNKKAIARA